MITLVVSNSFCSTPEHTKYDLRKISQNRSAGFVYIKHWRRREGITILSLFFPFCVSVWKWSAPQEYSHYKCVEFLLFQKLLRFDSGDWPKEMHLVRNFWPFLLLQHWGRFVYSGGLLIYGDLFAKCALSGLCINFYWKVIMPWMIISSCHLRQSGILQEEPFSRNYLGKWTYSFILVYASTCHSSPDEKWD